MSRVLNVALHELEQAALPPICAATARRDAADDIAPRRVLLLNVVWGWFLCALVGGPFIFVLLPFFAPRRMVRLPLAADAAHAIAQTNRDGLFFVRLGYVSFALVLWPFFYAHAATIVLLLLGLFGWLAGLSGIYRLCRQSHGLPGLVEIFSADRVALELPNWWVADEYRKALGHPPQGQPLSDQNQREEDAVWEARANAGSWDGAPLPVDNPDALPDTAPKPAPGRNVDDSATHSASADWDPPGPAGKG